MRPLRWFGYWLPLSLVVAAFSPLCAGVREDADAILETAGFTGGFIVHVGPMDGRLTAALKKNSATQVQGIVKSASEVEQARRRSALPRRMVKWLLTNSMALNCPM